MDIETQSQTPAFPQPQWAARLLARYQSGVAHAFILHFNVADYVVPGRSLKSFLIMLNKTREIIACYNRAEGITFPVPSMKERALELLGLKQPPTADPMRAALAAVNGGDELPRTPAQALPLLERLLKSDAKVAVIIDYAEHIAPEAGVSMMPPDDRTNLITLLRWGTDPDIAASGNPIFLVAQSLTDINSALRAASSKYEAVELPLPDTDIRRSFIEYYAAQKPAAFDWQVPPKQLVNASAGLSLLHIEDIFLRAEQTGSLTQQLVKERKDDIVRSEFGEVLEILEPRFGFAAIGGLEYVKGFFSRSVIDPLRDGRLSRLPMGVLLTGPAGTGKTAMAEALAWESGVNFVILSPARIFQGLVGQSERNLEKALRAIESLAPTIVFIDELDQAVSRGGAGDSGVSSRVFKRLLEFMSDTGHRGRVIFIAATNRPDYLDAALRRPGRFDRKIPFLVPEREERAAIFAVLARRYGLATAAQPLHVNDAALDQSEGWTGAEIEAAIVKALELVEDESLTPAEAVLAATNRLRPSTADIELMTSLAIAECNDTDLLPPSYRERLNDRAKLTQEVERAAGEQKPKGRGKREL